MNKKNKNKNKNKARGGGEGVKFAGFEEADLSERKGKEQTIFWGKGESKLL